MKQKMIEALKEFEINYPECQALSCTCISINFDPSNTMEFGIIYLNPEFKKDKVIIQIDNNGVTNEIL